MCKKKKKKRKRENGERKAWRERGGGRKKEGEGEGEEGKKRLELFISLLPLFFPSVPLMRPISLSPSLPLFLPSVVNPTQHNPPTLQRKAKLTSAFTGPRSHPGQK